MSHPLIAAILNYDEASLEKAVGEHRNLLGEPDDSGTTPLCYCVVQGFVEGVEVLMRHGCDVLQQNTDVFFSVGNIPILVTGGRMVSHFCAEKNEPEILRRILQKCDNETARCLLEHCDNDGNRAREVALLNNAHGVLEVLEVPKEEWWSEAEYLQNRLVWAVKQKRRISEVEAAKAAAKRKAIQAAYCPKHPVLFTDEGRGVDVLLHPSLLRLAEATTYEELRGLGMTELIAEPGNRVVIVPVLQPSLCSMLWEEAEHFEATMGDAVRRPNSMNNYGVVLNDMGLGPLMDRWGREYFTPISQALYDGEDTGRGPFATQHSFTIRYKLGEDTALAEHMDQSDFTVNICLGDATHEGGNVYFKDTASKTVEHHHKAGCAVLHRGDIRHGATPLTSGVRCNVVVWYRHR